MKRLYPALILIGLVVLLALLVSGEPIQISIGVGAIILGLWLINAKRSPFRKTIDDAVRRLNDPNSR